MMTGLKLWLVILEGSQFDHDGFNRLFRDQLAELLPRVNDASRRAGLDALREFDFVACILAALRNAGFADWPLPEPFAVLRRRFEATWGQPGLRHFIRMLRLLEHASLAELAAAVERALAFGVTTADGVRVLLEQTRETPVPLFPLDGRPHLAGLSVPAPDLSAYHAVRAGGGA